MNIQEQIKADTIKSMKAKTPEVTNVLRVVSGEFARIGKEVSDEQAIKIIRKMATNANEQGNTNEQEILETYLPKMLSKEELEIEIKLMISSRGITSMKGMGQIMGALRSHPKTSQIDGKLASTIVKELLS